MLGKYTISLRSLGFLLLASFSISCNQLSSISESLTPAASPVAHTGKPPQAPIIRIETDMHTARISSISVDDAGHYLVTASDDKTLRVWDRSTGRLLRVLRPPIGQGNEGKMYTVAISPDGETIAGAGWSGLEWDGTHSIYLFDRSSGRMLKRITGLPESIPHVAFSPDGRILLVTFHGKYGVRFYRTADSRLLAEDGDYQAETYGASFDKSGRVVTASYDGSLRLYGRDFRLLAQTPIAGGKRPFTVSLTSSGSKVAVGYENAPQADVFSGEDLHYLYSADTAGSNTGHFNVVCWSADENTLYAGGQYRIGQTHLIRKWMKQGQGRWTDLPASSNTILRIVSLKTGGIAYGASDPAFGIIDRRDVRSLFRDSDVLNYRDNYDNFLLSSDAATIQFSYRQDKTSILRFSVGDRLLQSNSSPLPTLHPPRTTAAGMAIEGWRNAHAPVLNGRSLRLMPYEVSRCLAIAPDHQTALLGTVWHLRLFDSRGRELWTVAVPANVWNVNIAENGLVATAALADGTIRWYRMADGQELLALFVHVDGKRWIAWTPSGYYDAGPGAETLLGWHKNYGNDAAADFFPAAHFRSVSYRPNVVKTTLETLDEQQAVLRTSLSEVPAFTANSDIQTTDQHPVVIITPHDGASVSSTTVKVRYRVHGKTQTEPTEILVMVDGQMVSGTRGIKILQSSAAAGIRELDVQIPERDCEISLALADQTAGKSTPVSVRVKWRPTFAVKPMLYVLAIGVNDQVPTSLAGKDAKDFVAALQQHTGGLYRGIATKVLIDGDASKDSILDGLDWLDQETTSKDVAMLFIKGQAVADRNGTPYLLPTHAKMNHLRLTALPFSDVRNLAGGLAGRSAIFMDVCQANDPRNAEACTTAVMRLGNDLSNAEQGVALFSASTAHHEAQENPARENGMFTTALIEGLNGQAALAGAKQISVSMLDLYLSQRIKALTNNQQIPPSPPLRSACSSPSQQFSPPITHASSATNSAPPVTRG